MTIQLNRRAVLGGMLAAAGLAVAGCEQVALVAMNQMELTEFRVEGDKLYMNGPINHQTLDQFEAVYARHPNIKTLVELDVPGSVDDDTMIRLAYRVRALGLNTHLTSDSVIQSGGVDLFVAGVRRTMEVGARIGVHSWSDGFRDAADYPRSSPEHEANRRYIERMLGDDAFYWFTIYAAPADGMHFMSEGEINQFGLINHFWPA